MTGQPQVTGQPPVTGRLRVAKVGGSLLDWQPLAVALGRWLDQQPPGCTVLIAGGGALADAIRRADRVHGLGEAASHALCIEVLGVTGRLLMALLAGRAKGTTWSELHGPTPVRLRQDCVVLEVSSFLAAPDSDVGHRALPHTWEVTSDSISAAVASALAADELVLFKSCELPADMRCDSDTCPRQLATAGLVDPYFPTASARFRGRVRFVNLRGL